MGKSIDIEKYLDKSVLKPLLKDKTTKKNIIFATDSYDSAYFSSEITEEYMLKEYVRLFTRANKKAEEKNDRTKKKAEVFTPSWLCNKMNNYLDFEWFEREFVFNSEMENSWEVNTEKNPGCFDLPDKTFIDLYMKSGLYIAEIVKRLYKSENMKKLYPDKYDRLKHIFEKQVYGLAPTEIIYKIATNYILGFDNDYEITKHNFRQVDTLPYANEGMLKEKLDEIYGE